MAAAVRSCAMVIVAAIVVLACSGTAPAAVPSVPAAPVVEPTFDLGDTSQTGDRTVSKAETISGQVAGTLTVAKGGELVLNGQVTEDLVVEKGGSANVYGMVIGQLLNQGGKATVYGQVGGIKTTAGGKTTVESGAVVNGSQVP